MKIPSGKVGSYFRYTNLGQLPTCPKCNGTNNVSQRGNVIIEGCTQDNYFCSNCNYMFLNFSGDHKAYLNEIQKETGATAVTINLGSSGATITGSDSTGYVDATSIAPTINTYNLENNTQQSNYKLDSLNNEMREMKYQIMDLCQTIRDIAHQNQVLQEKLLTDPLIGIRDKINKFNLE